LPYCGDNGSGWGAKVRASSAADSLLPYTGSAVVTAVGIPTDLPAPWTQRSLTLKTPDGNTIDVNFAMLNADPPVLDALLQKHVQVLVSPDEYGGYMGDGELTLRDDSGLILSVKWDMGGWSVRPVTIAGIDVNIGPAVCVNSCGASIHTLQFTGTSSVELAEGEHGTFQSGASNFTAYTMICADAGTKCADGYAISSFGVFRDGL
jgi:hypothetical protein